MPTYKATLPHSQRVMVGIPMTGLIRSEWAMARWGQTIPCNWSQVELIRWMTTHAPLGYLVADARNVIVDEFLKGRFDWLFFVDHDVILPPGTILRLSRYMQDPVTPLYSGLYFTKSVPSEPLIYRKRGTGYYNRWKLGDKVWVDGMGMGCTIIHRSLLKACARDVPEYKVENRKIKKVFITPSYQHQDPETKEWEAQSGTEDLELCSRIIEHKLLKEAGWPELAGKEYPFLIDTSLFCRHIDMSGVQYPSMGEENEFMPVKKKPVKKRIKKYAKCQAIAR